MILCRVRTAIITIIIFIKYMLYRYITLYKPTAQLCTEKKNHSVITRVVDTPADALTILFIPQTSTDDFFYSSPRERETNITTKNRFFFLLEKISNLLKLNALKKLHDMINSFVERFSKNTPYFMFFLYNIDQ